MTTRRTIAAALAFASAALSGCSSAAKSPSSVSLLPAQPGAAQPVGAYIKHVVIIIQENRTFDNVFRSYPGADSATTGKTSTGKTVTLQPIGFVKKDMIHDWQHAIIDWDKGKMDGFDQNLLTNRTSAGLFSYSYLGRQFVQPYWTMAQQYVLGDRMFATMFGQSYTAHLTLIAATADLKPNLSLVDDPSSQPWGCDAPLGTTVRTINARREFTTYAPFPCFTQFKTMEDTMDPKHVTWRYYQPQNSRLWSAFDSVRNVRFGPAWKANIGQSNTEILKDAAAGKLPQISWVVPDWLNSDQPAAGSDTGPSWVAAIVNSIGKGPDWDSTAIFVVWDDWGSWYDHVPPPQLSFTGLGMRVPVLIISPYAKKGYVSHTQYEFASVLKFAEKTFDLPRIGPPSFGYADTRANDMLDAFDFTQSPRPFKMISAKYPTSYFFGQKPSGKPVDDE